jgi:uncharacterized protein YndB with AHSA1/START domain
MSDEKNVLEISRFVAVPRARVWRAWADPAMLAQWWCPRPWTTEVRAFEFRAGGDFHTFMRGPDGGESDNPGCFLEVVERERIVFTSMLTGGWRPATPWLGMTAVFTLADEGEGTRYVARVMHRDEADAQKHVEMGFYDGWNTCVTQLEEFARGL